MPLIDLAVGVAIGLYILLGSTSWGYIFLRTGWPKVRSLELDSKTGASVIIGFIVITITIIISAIIGFLDIPLFTLPEIILLVTTVILSASGLVFTLKRKLSGNQKVRVSVPKRAIAANIAAKKAFEKVPETKYIKVSSEGIEKLRISQLQSAPEMSYENEAKKTGEPKYELITTEKKDAEKIRVEKIKEPEKKEQEKTPEVKKELKAPVIEKSKKIVEPEPVQKTPIKKEEPVIVSQAVEKKPGKEEPKGAKAIEKSDKKVILQEHTTKEKSNIPKEKKKSIFAGISGIFSKKKSNKITPKNIQKKTQEEKPVAQDKVSSLKNRIAEDELSVGEAFSKPREITPEKTMEQKKRNIDAIISALEKKRSERTSGTGTKEEMEKTNQESERYITDNLKQEIHIDPKKPEPEKEPELDESRFPKSAKLLKELLKDK